MGPVEKAVRGKVVAGTVLDTTARQESFTVDRIDDLGVVLLLGLGENPVRLSWDCLEGVIGFLDGKGAIPIGGTHTSEGEPGTLDEYLKTCTPVNTARWVAVLLEAAGVGAVLPGRPVLVAMV